MSPVIFENEVMSVKRLCILLSAQVNTLELVDVTLDGDADDLYELSKVFRSHPYLKQIKLVNVTLSKSKLSLDGLVCTIFAAVKNLEMVHLEQLNVAPTALTAVGHNRSPNFYSFAAINMRLNDNTAPAIVSALASSKTMCTVDLSGNHISEKGCDLIKAALEGHNNIVSVNLDENDPSAARAVMDKNKTIDRRGTAAHAA